MVPGNEKHRLSRSQICLKLILLAVSLACLTGCVRRRMTIRTNPPGAVVYVDDYQIGTTPVSTNFVHYGTRKIRIVKDGYETLTVEQPIPAPWYQIPPIDFVAETLVPKEIRDHRTLNYQLVPQRVVPPDELRARAEDLRARVRPTGVVPAANFVQPPPGTGYGLPGSIAPSEPISSPPPSRYVYPPSMAPGSQPVVPPPTTLPPSIAPSLPPGGRTLPPGGMPIR